MSGTANSHSFCQSGKKTKNDKKELDRRKHERQKRNSTVTGASDFSWTYNPKVVDCITCKPKNPEWRQTSKKNCNKARIAILLKYLSFLSLYLTVPLLSFMVVQSLNHVQLFVTPWTLAHQAPLSMGFPRQEYWSGLLFPPPGGSSWPRDGTSCVSCIGRRILYHWETFSVIKLTSNKTSKYYFFKRKKY